MPEKNENYRILLHFLAKAKGIRLYSFLAIGHTVLTALIPLFLGRYIDALVYRGDPLSSFFLLAMISGADVLLGYLANRQILMTAQNEEISIQMRLLDSLHLVKPSAMDHYRNGEVALKFFRDAVAVKEFIRACYPQILNMLFCFLCSSILVLAKCGGLALLYLLFIPLLFLLTTRSRKGFRKVNQKIRILYDRSMNRIFEFMHVLPYLKSLSAETPYFRDPRRKFHFFNVLNRRNLSGILRFETGNRMILYLGEFTVLGFAGYLAWKQKIPIGDVVVVQVLFLSVLRAVSGLFQVLPMLETAKEGSRSILELLETRERENTSCGKILPACNGDISVRHISFSYPHSDRKILDDFSCEIPGGSIVGVTGVNGAGKTTLLHLLTGYLQPESGDILLAGERLAELQKKSFREKTASVFQDSLLITGTIRDNITLLNPHYTEDDITRALILSGADTLVKRMPEGLEHFIGFEGGGLSGGERQKLAIARALIRKPDLLIFDEVTNHLDYESRMRIKEILQTCRGKVTVLLVSHDPEIISECDMEIQLATGDRDDRSTAAGK